MITTIPILKQEIKDGQLLSQKQDITLTIDTSVYSEERWEQHFPVQAAREGLFQYIERIQQEEVSERVRVAAMLKALYCFVESDKIPSYKDFAQLFVLSEPDYTTELIDKLLQTFKLILNRSTVKNS